MRARQLLAACFLALVSAGTAGAEQLAVHSYGIENGLAGDSVTAVVQDSRGYLWFGTTDGVSRFDGERFINYGSADGLPHARVHALLESRDGTWWVGTQGGLARLIPDRPVGRPAFESVRLASRRPEPVFSLYEDRAGRIWAGGAGRLFVLESGKSGWTARTIGLEELPAPPESIEAFAETQDGSLWIGTQQGLLRRLPDGRTSFHPVLPHFGQDRVLDLEVDREGRLWVVHTLHVFVLKPGPVRMEKTPPTSLAQTAGGAAELPKRPGEVSEIGGSGGSGWRRAVATGDGRMRLISNRGLFLWDGALRAWNEENGLSERSLTALAEDRDGNLWLGTEGRGAMRVARNGFLGFTSREGLAHPQVRSIFEGSDGKLYVHSGDTFDAALWLHRFDGSDLAAARPRLPPALSYLGWSLRQTAVLDRSGQWWIATGQGLLRFPPGTAFGSLAASLPSLITKRDGLGGNRVERLFEDSRGNLWIGTNGQRPLSRWDRATGAIRSFGSENGLPEGLPSALAQDAAGQIWIGFSRGELLRYRGGRFERFGPERGLAEGPVSDLHIDLKGRLWVATEGGGIARLERPPAAASSSQRFVRTTTREGLSSDEIRCLTSDRWGRIYLGGHKGIDRLDPESGRVEHFTTADGLASNLVDAAFRDREGRLWFGTRRGLSQLVPQREPSSPVPSPWITAVRVDGVPQRVSELGAPRVTGIELESGHGRLEIEFLGLSFAPGKSLAYQYRMDGFEREWSRASSSRSVVYARLPPGGFRFLVRAVAPEARSASIVPAEVLLTVHPPLWRRAWVLVLGVLVVAAGAAALYRYRVSHLLALERMRTRIATDLHDDLGSSLSRISILSEVARRRAEKDPEGARLVTDIGESAREMMESLGESIWAIDPRRDDLRSLVTRIRRFAGDLLEARGIAWSLQAPPDAEQVKLSPVERRQLYLIFKEALHNAARHSDASSVSMSFAPAGRWLRATIRDDGKGFAELDEGETRRGLGSMNARAARLGGELAIQSVPGRGTEIRFEVPLSGRIS